MNDYLKCNAISFSALWPLSYQPFNKEHSNNNSNLSIETLLQF